MMRCHGLVGVTVEGCVSHAQVPHHVNVPYRNPYSYGNAQLHVPTSFRTQVLEGESTWTGTRKSSKWFCPSHNCTVHVMFTAFQRILSREYYMPLRSFNST